MMGCDYVLVMKDGCIHQEGTHDKLMADENGEYSSLIKSFHDAEVKESEQQVTTSAVVGRLHALKLLPFGFVFSSCPVTQLLFV